MRAGRNGSWSRWSTDLSAHGEELALGAGRTSQRNSRSVHVVSQGKEDEQPERRCGIGWGLAKQRRRDGEKKKKQRAIRWWGVGKRGRIEGGEERASPIAHIHTHGLLPFYSTSALRTGKPAVAATSLGRTPFELRLKSPPDMGTANSGSPVSLAVCIVIVRPVAHSML
ncbi:hypothetical protein BDW22DRAFT_482750 [Trametopsis cervina]|nr:hypothetical protein BDW22DRAFT_482750 [Trametopsis cervina]